MKVRCSKCGYEGDESEFPKGRDFFQNSYIASCPMGCGNGQSPGGASMRMMGGERPFVYVRDAVPNEADALDITLHRADEAS